MKNEGEIILYQSDNALQLEVRLEDETVWLTQKQMGELFETTRNNITLHVANVFKEKELDKKSVCKESLLTATDGKKYKTTFYNLDVIISIGYRVKSKRGTQFRIWANRFLKDYLLKGYAVNQRFDRVEEKLFEHGKKLQEHEQKFDLLIKTSLPPVYGIFFDGQIFDAYVFVSKLIRQAKKSIILIDNYIDETVLNLFSKSSKNVTVLIYTAKISNRLQLDIDKYNAQYESIKVQQFSKSHDRFLIIDNSIIYHIGASLKDLGKRWFAFSKINLPVKEILSKLPG